MENEEKERIPGSTADCTKQRLRPFQFEDRQHRHRNERQPEGREHQPIGQAICREVSDREGCAGDDQDERYHDQGASLVVPEHNPDEQHGGHRLGDRVANGDRHPTSTTRATEAEPTEHRDRFGERQRCPARRATRTQSERGVTEHPVGEHRDKPANEQADRDYGDRQECQHQRPLPPTPRA